MKEKDFNLLYEPWILALDLTGRTRSLSLVEVFRDAHQLHRLAGEMEAQNVALLRILLAVLYAIYGWEDAQGQEGLITKETEAWERWRGLYARGQFDAGRIEAYFQEWQEQFFLFHPQTPFMQAAISLDATVIENGQALQINPLGKKVKNYIGDLVESDNKTALFSYRQNTETLSYAESARWLVHLNSYDVSPLGAPPRGFFRAKGFKLPWPNQLGLVWAQGSNLFETLLLNLVLVQNNQDAWQSFSPSWEGREAFVPQDLASTSAVFPEDPAHLFTFPFRHLQLQRNPEGQVTECTVWGGSLVDTESGNFLTETMTLWRKDKQGRVLPKKHDPSRQMWRDFASLLSTTQGHPPGVVSWLASLQQGGYLPTQMLKLSIASVALSSKFTSVDDAFSDSLHLHTALLADLEEGWPACITRELQVTEKLVHQLGYFASDLVRAGGGSGNKEMQTAKDEAQEDAYFLLDIPFRQWLLGIDDKVPMSEACKQWRKTQRDLFYNKSQQMVARLGQKALVGRMIKPQNTDKEYAYAAPALQLKFLAQMKKILAE